MNFSIRLVFVLALGCFGSEALFAQDKKAKEKTPADLAGDAFFKLREQKDVEPTLQRQAEIIKVGLAYLKEYANEGKANQVISSLATFGATMKDKKQAALRLAWLSKLQYEILNQGGGEQNNKAAPAAFKALSAAVAGQLVREVALRDNVTDFREKIDRLAEMPESSRFIVDQERSYIQILRGMKNVALAEKHATALLTNSEKRLVSMAQEELNLIRLAKQPLELAFTGLDGKAVDVAKMRGKVVLFYFWATTHEGSLKAIDSMWEDGLNDLPRDDYALIFVSCDKAEAREAVEKFVKKNRLNNPVWFTGTGMDNELGKQANISKLPGTMVFDAKGMFISSDNELKKGITLVKKVLGIKKSNGGD